MADLGFSKGGFSFVIAHEVHMKFFAAMPTLG